MGVGYVAKLDKLATFGSRKRRGDVVEVITWSHVAEQGLSYRRFRIMRISITYLFQPIIGLLGQLGQLVQAPPDLNGHQIPQLVV
jgi:hypothetical protein